MQIKWFLLILLVFLGLVGRWDIEDEKLQVKIYCERVSSGYWTNYKHIDCN